MYNLSVVSDNVILATLFLYFLEFFTMALFDDLKNAAQDMFDCEQKEDQKIGNVQIPYKVWMNFKREFEINFIEPEDDEDWQNYQGDLHAT